MKYWNDLAIARRKDQLERTNQQLRLLYGPLYAIDRTQREAWNAFRNLYRNGMSFWNADPPPSDEDKAAWRLWMKEVFMPMNLEMERVIVGYADLLEEDDMPDCLLALASHIAAYKAVLQQWEQGDYSKHTSVINFPERELRDYVTHTYKLLKSRQSVLLTRLGRKAPDAVTGGAAE